MRFFVFRFLAMAQFCLAVLLSALAVLVYGCADIGQESPETEELAEVIVTEDIVEDMVWGSANSGYTIQETISVVRGATLTIHPDTEIRFGRDVALIVKGTLAAGTPLAANSVNGTVLFTADTLVPGPDFWEGIRFENTNDTASFIRGCIVEYASIGIYVTSSSPTITDCIVHTNNIGIVLHASNSSIEHNCVQQNRVGVSLRGKKSSPSIRKNNIGDNENGVVFRDGAPIFQENNIAGNRGYAVSVEGGLSIRARHDWWGTVLKSEVERLIFDANDEPLLPMIGDQLFTRGKVIYDPLMHGPIEDAGVRWSSSIPFRSWEK